MRTKLKTERSTRPIPKKRPLRDSYKAIPEKKMASDNYNATNASRTVLLKGGDKKRSSRKTALLTGRYARTIQLSLKHLKGVGIGMTDWLNVLPRGRGVTELPYHPKVCYGMLY